MTDTESEYAVVLRGVSRTYRPVKAQEVFALRDVDLEVEAGEAVALVGASGAGKSTLLQLVGAMDQPDAGELMADGRRLDGAGRRELQRHRRRVGFVFQRFHLLPALTVVDNVIAPVLPQRVDFDKRERALELLASVGLGDRARSLPSMLSGGEQQRVAIARALIGRPALLLADEPTGNLDSTVGGEIVDLLLSMRERHDATLLIATHNSAVASACDRTVRLHDGRVVADSAAVA
ncbi:MAG: ABC transporter ATP-binding protein [Actinomycetota bacterium]